MLLLNTTFYVESSLADDFSNWICNTYIPAAMASGCVIAPIFSKLMIEVEEGMEGFAMQFQAESSQKASEWQDGEGDRLRGEYAMLHPGKVLSFSTYMEILYTK